jgi:HSP20 family protein
MANLARTNRNFFPSIPSLFEDMFNRDWTNFPTTTNGGDHSMPAVNVRETAQAYELEVAAPGMTKQDFKIELDNNNLIISAEKQSNKEDKDKEGNYSRREFSYQSFVRTFSLPERLVKGDAIAAKYKDGILHVSIPKTEEGRNKQVKQISIS